MEISDKIIDLRSDTVTKPTPAMRKVMGEAKVGDDVYGEDPTVHELECLAAEMTGKAAAILATSGTQSNLLGILSHCRRGDEYIVGQEAHTYKYEAGGAAVLGSVQPQPILFEPDKTLDLEKVAAVIKPAEDIHFAKTRLLCLENTQAGRVLPLDYVEQAGLFAKKKGLRLHLDGARVFNAAVNLGVPVTGITRHFDSVSVCLSKGLGAPVGSVLCGSKALIGRARRWRKMLGGGMRQAGILAAAGIMALKENITGLSEDHENARRLAEGLSGIDALKGVSGVEAYTNMVFFELDPVMSEALTAYCRNQGLLLGGRGMFRLVTHLDVSAADVDRAVSIIKTFFAEA